MRLSAYLSASRARRQPRRSRPLLWRNPPRAAPTQADPVVATVNGMKIHFSEIQADAQAAPSSPAAPPSQLFPLLVSQEIDRRALLVAARKENLENNPEVAAAMAPPPT